MANPPAGLQVQFTDGDRLHVHIVTHLTVNSALKTDAIDVHLRASRYGGRYLNITDVGVVRSMREYWGRQRETGRAHA
jgi:hypothetical protein